MNKTFLVLGLSMVSASACAQYMEARVYHVLADTTTYYSGCFITPGPAPATTLALDCAMGPVVQPVRYGIPDVSDVAQFDSQTHYTAIYERKNDGTYMKRYTNWDAATWTFLGPSTRVAVCRSRLTL